MFATASLGQSSKAALVDLIRDVQAARPACAGRVPDHKSSQRSGVGPTMQPDWRPCWRGGNRRLSNTVADHGCEGQEQKKPRNTSTYAVPTSPWALLSRVNRRRHIDRARTLRRSLKKTDREENARSNRPNSCMFAPAATIVAHAGVIHWRQHFFGTHGLPAQPTGHYRLRRRAKLT